MDDETFNVPFTVYEAAMVRAEKEKETVLKHTAKETTRAHILCIILIAVLLLCNIGWIIGLRLFINDFFENYEIVVEEGGISIEGDNANYIGNDGDIYNGTNKRPDAPNNDP